MPKMIRKGSDGTYTMTIEGVEPGTYTVTETTKHPDGTKTVETKTLQVLSGNKAAVAPFADETDSSQPSKATEKTGSLKLTKTLKGDITEEEAEGALTFEVKTSGGKWVKADGSLSTTKEVLTLKAFSHQKGTMKYSLTLKKLPAGKYTVTETTKDITGKKMSAAYRLTDADGEAVVVADGRKCDLTVKNGKTTKLDYADKFTKSSDLDGEGSDDVSGSKKNGSTSGSSGSGSSTGGSGTRTGSPTTGDDTPIEAYSWLLVLAALMIIAVMIQKRRKAK